MNRILLPVLFMVCLFQAAAQNGIPSYVSGNTYLNNYVQPAPNAASLGKYADYPVSYYTGTPEISVPLYNLQDGAANMPISISYHASGIKVSETASWVGLGWALNAGGVIIRTVRGAPDEGSGYGLGGYTGPTGYYKSYGLSSLPLLPYPGASGSFQGLNTYPPKAIMAGYMDTEPDLFTFNFNGMMGKFVFDENRNVHLLTDDNLLIIPTYDGTSFISWMVTDGNGVKYYFGENSAYEVSLPSSYWNGGLVDPRSNHPSNWYLTRIVYPNTKDTIQLNYTPEKYLYRDLPPESSIYEATNDANGLANACRNTMVANDVLQTTVNGVRLTSIVSKNYKIVLAAHTSRQDLTANANPLPYALDSVNVYTTQGLCLKRFLLGHSYFTSTAASSTANILNTLSILKDTTDRKRLKLTSLTEYSGDGTIAKPPYNFNYSESIQLPRRLSYDQDHWGYANNSSGSNNSFFTPAVTNSLCVNPTGGANRGPRWPDMQAFSLINMVDPLGVVTNFFFEAHSADIGGLRIQKITTTDSLTGSVKIRSFTYGGLALFHNPQYLIVPNNEFYFVNVNGGNSYQGYSYANKIMVRNIIKQSQSIVPLQDVQGNHVGYSSVVETFGARGEGGSKYYAFQTNGAGNESSRLDLYNYANYGSFYVNGVYISLLAGNGLFNGIPPENLNYHPGYSGLPYYPITPDQTSYGRGRLGAEFTYDSAGNLLQSISKTFAITLHENYLIRGLKSFRTNILNLISGSPSGGYWDAFSFYKLHTGIAHLMSTTVTNYKDGKAMATVTNYAYESPYHTLQTGETTVNSTGDTIVKKTYYSFDYANSATTDQVFNKMKARNILVPIATRIWKNNTLIGGAVTQYKDFATSSADTFINPAKIYSMETTTPLTVAQAGESVALTGQLATLLPDTNFVEKADFNFNGTTGRVIEQKLVNDKNQALIWDNQFQLPLAKVDNASFADIAYCSFETAETGNWVFTGSAIVSDTTAPTGVKAYAVTTGVPISASGLTPSKTYVISYWSKSGASISISGGTQSGSLTGLTLNGWTYHELTVTGTATLSITGTGSVDEIRLYPSTAQMLTYTYDANLRLIASCGVNSLISHYEYDALHRLTDIKDQNGNVIKAYEYNYGRQSR